MSKRVVALRNELREKKKAYHDSAALMTVADAEVAASEIAALTSAHAAEIAVGATPCPFCDKPPTGIEHQVKSGFEYQIGCLSCPVFVHTDGTTRRVTARGGALPRHAVELWNEGPDYWLVNPVATEFATPIIGRANTPEAASAVDETPVVAP